MREELDRKLVEAFPHLYADRGASMMQTCMCWGFSCGDGWFELIWKLSALLEAEILAMPEEERVHVKASQVKEKYGTLHFYMTCATDKMFDLIDAAEKDSEKVCEECGKPGKMRERYYWYRVRCDDCWNKFKEKE